MQDNNIDELQITDYSNHIYVVKDGWLFEKHIATMLGEERTFYWRQDSTANGFDKKEKALWEDLNKKILENNETLN